jgi:hypothetical protein
MPRNESEQNRPSFSSEIMSGLAKYRAAREQMLFIVAGAGGLRVGEALGIEIDKHLSADCSTVSIEQKPRRGRVESRLKTTNAKRQVDLDPDVAKLVKQFIGLRTSGFLFQTRTGKPLSPSNILRRHLHPALKELRYVNSYTEAIKPGTMHSAVFATRTSGTRLSVLTGSGITGGTPGVRSTISTTKSKMMSSSGRRWQLRAASASNYRLLSQLYRMYRKLPKKPMQQRRHKQLKNREKEWSGREDLNLRPPGPEPGALPG